MILILQKNTPISKNIRCIFSSQSKEMREKKCVQLPVTRNRDQQKRTCRHKTSNLPKTCEVKEAYLITPAAAL
jgi:hypothetical protein